MRDHEHVHGHQQARATAGACAHVQAYVYAYAAHMYIHDGQTKSWHDATEAFACMHDDMHVHEIKIYIIDIRIQQRYQSKLTTNAYVSFNCE